MSQEINLLKVGPTRSAFSATSANAMGIGVLVAGLLTALLGAYENHRLQAVQREAQAIERTVKDARAALEKAAAAVKASKPDGGQDPKLAELEAQMHSREQVIQALRSGVIGTTSGFSEYLLALSRQSVAGVWLTAFDFAAGGKELTLSGRALSPDLVPLYLQRLTQETPLQGRRFASMVISQPPRDAPVEAAQGGKAAKTPATPAYVDFEISSEAGASTAAAKGEAVK